MTFSTDPYCSGSDEGTSSTTQLIRKWFNMSTSQTQSLTEIINSLVRDVTPKEKVRRAQIIGADQVALATALANVGEGKPPEVWKRAYVRQLEEFVALGVNSPMLKKGQADAQSTATQLRLVKNGETSPVHYIETLQAGAKIILARLRILPAYKEMMTPQPAAQPASKKAA